MRNILLTFFATCCFFLAMGCYGFMSGRLTYYVYVTVDEANKEVAQAPITKGKGYDPKLVAERQQLIDFYTKK